MTSVEMLRRVTLFAGLPDGDLQALAGRLGKRAFAKGVIIFHADSPGSTLYIIESGRVRIFALSDAGQQMSINIYGPGESFGELSALDGQPRSAGAVTLEDTVTYTLQRADLLLFLEEHPRLAIRIMHILSARLRYTTEYAESLVFLDVCGRVAAKLLELSERYGLDETGTALDLQLTQGELASWVGATRESVNKVLRRLQDQGLIEIDGQRISLLDPRGLERLIVY